MERREWNVKYEREMLVSELMDKYHCSHTCAFSTVTLHFPDKAKCEAVVQGKMTTSFVEVVGLVAKQREYFDSLCANLCGAFAQFPLLHGKGTTADEEDVHEAAAGASSAAVASRPPIDWAAVREGMFSRHRALLWYEHTQLANIGVPDDLVVLENAYRALATYPGFSHLLGCYASGDGVVVATDYVNERICGTPVQEIARRAHFPDELVEALSGVEWEAPTAVLTRVNAFGNNPATSHTKRQDKGSSQTALRDAGLAYIRSVVSTDPEAAVQSIRDGSLLLPVVVKPSTGAGSEFVTLCYTEEDIRVAYEMVDGMMTSQGTDARVLVVEEYIEGPEYVVNTVSYDGVAVVTDLWQSWKFPKSVYTTGMSLAAERNLRPTSLQDRKRNKTSILYDKQTLIPDLASLPPTHEARRVAEYTLKCLDALELRNGCAHCELRVDMRAASAARRRRDEAAKAGASSSSSSSLLKTAAADGGNSAYVGEPVLIELNPRMQGDAPRSTEVVGYDQFSLMVYISEAVNIFGGATAASTQVPFRGPNYPSQRGDIPWPPVPRLYHALEAPNPPATTVLFLVANSDCILNGAALPCITSLETFTRFTRTIFTPNLPGYATPLRQTVDLFSSPSACVMRGPPAQVEADCQAIRAMETAEVSLLTRNMLQDAVSTTERLRLMRSALRNPDRHVLQAEDTQRDSPVPFEDDADLADDRACTPPPQLLAESTKQREMQLATVRETEGRLEELVTTIRQELMQQSPQPLYIPYDIFNLMKHCNLGSVLSVM